MKYSLFCVLLPLLGLGACASAVKRRCEATNWFEYGQSVALSGKRLNADNFVGECKKEEVPVDEAQLDVGFKSGMQQYCTLEGAVETGRKGDKFNADLCDPGVIPDLHKAYRKGTEVYCRPDNGYEQGALGREYHNVCPDALEVAFLKQFKRGKHVYIENRIDAKQGELRDAQMDLDDAGHSESRARGELMAIQTAQTIARARSSGPEVDASFESQKNSLESRISSEGSRRGSAEGRVQRIRSEIAELRVQLGATAE